MSEQDIIGAARRLNVSAVVKPDDIPEGVALVEEEDILKHVNGHNIALMDNGWFLTDNPGGSEVLKIYQKVQSYSEHSGIPLKIIPARANIIEIIKSHSSQQRVVEVDSKSDAYLGELLEHAVEHNWSDIHLEFRKSYTNIKIRKNGMLMAHDSISNELSYGIRNLISNWKADKFDGQLNPLLPQDGSMALHVKEEFISVRIATGPDRNGQDMILRIQRDAKKNLVSLNELGYGKGHLAILRECIREPQGAIIITGPTGSGKSTSMAAALSEIPNTKKIITVEDPVEIPLSNATQISVDDDIKGRSYRDLCKGLLRLDPDVIMLGEVRDHDSAFAAVRAASTGHLLFTTLHTNRAMTIPDSLVDLGIERSRLLDSSLLLLLVSQRLVPALCPKCRIPLAEYMKAIATNEDRIERVTAHIEYFEDNDIDPTVLFYQHEQGCDHCGGSGVLSRTAVLEMIRIDDDCLRFIANDDKTGWLAYLKENGWEDYKDHARHLCKRGIIDPMMAEATVGAFVRSSAAYSYARIKKSVKWHGHQQEN